MAPHRSAAGFLLLASLLLAVFGQPSTDATLTAVTAPVAAPRTLPVGDTADEFFATKTLGQPTTDATPDGPPSKTTPAAASGSLPIGDTADDFTETETIDTIPSTGFPSTDSPTRPTVALPAGDPAGNGGSGRGPAPARPPAPASWPGRVGNTVPLYDHRRRHSDRGCYLGTTLGYNPRPKCFWDTCWWHCNRIGCLGRACGFNRSAYERDSYLGWQKEWRWQFAEVCKHSCQYMS